MQLGRILSKSELNEQDEKGRSALHFACANGNHQVCFVGTILPVMKL